MRNKLSARDFSMLIALLLIWAYFIFAPMVLRNDYSMTFVSSRGTTFREDTGAGGGFLLTVFQRHGDEVYRTYNTTSRGLDRNAFVTGMLDLTAYGRREDWENSPQGWPQQPTYITPTEMEWGQDSTGFGRFR